MHFVFAVRLDAQGDALTAADLQQRLARNGLAALHYEVEDLFWHGRWLFGRPRLKNQPERRNDHHSYGDEADFFEHRFRLAKKSPAVPAGLFLANLKPCSKKSA